jgi:hypothetical protein
MQRCRDTFLREAVMAQAMPIEHQVHTQHAHVQGSGCGHTAIRHDGHTDYLHDGHLHHLHGDHCDTHGTISFAGNAIS